MRQFLFILVAIFTLISCKGQNDLVENRMYICKEVPPLSISIDGIIDSIWTMAPWSSSFVDIEGDQKPKPYLDTKIKMLWDSAYFYILAELEEPHVWAKLTERDDIIFYDNDFEVFIDPDGDTHGYTEIEINAFNTIWDLLLTKPYRDGGNALHQYDIKGLQTAVKIKGTLNDPSDKDEGWIIEMAIPWKSFGQTTSADWPPKKDHVWRVNFSRVQWETQVIDNTYEKVIDEATGKPKPEMNWVWSPQRVIAMHEPEFWGTVIFKTQENNSEAYYADFLSEEIRQRLYEIHRKQRLYFRNNKQFKTSTDSLLSVQHFVTGDQIVWDMRSDQYTYHIVMQHPHDRMLLWHLDHTGRIWREIRE